jgi:CheY-like chemotaxis protein
MSDQGVGIEEKDFDFIFDRFRQVSADTLKDKPKGTGLGLPICKDIITHYGGNIWVKSEKGKGSTFFFTLPAARPEAEVVSSVPQTSGQPTSRRKGRTILLLEENVSVRRVLCSQLERKGFTVLESSDMHEVHDLARNQRINLILLDLMMPGLAEEDILRTLRECPETENIPVLIISVVESEKSGILPGAHGFLKKPFREEDLIRKVQGLLKDRSRSILVVDDDPGVRNSLRMHLEDMGYPVYLAADGDEALDLLKTSIPDLVILDLVMPRKNGHEVLSWIRNNLDTRDLPVIILSGFQPLEEVDQLCSLGIEAFVEKSEDLAPLFNKINSVLEIPLN